MRFKATTVQQFVEQIYKAYGFSTEDSQAIATTLVDADLRGIRSHGVQRISMYDQKIQSKFILPYNKWTVTKQTKLSLLVDANQTMGQLAAIATMSQVVSKAQRQGIAVGVVRNSNHFGAAGYYARMAAKENLIGVAMTNTNPLLVPPGATVPFLGSNPLAFSFPLKGKPPFVFDAATSAVSLGKIEVRLKDNQSLPGEWAIDADGQLETNPQTVLDELSRTHRVGGILPLGGLREANSNYKGFGNALLIESLTSILAQGAISADLGNRRHHVSHFFLALDPELFGDFETISANLDDMLDRLRRLNHLPGQSITVPGDHEIDQVAETRRKGIVIDEITFDELNQIAQRLGVSPLSTANKVKE